MNENPMDDMQKRAREFRTTLRVIAGRPEVGFRDVLSLSIASAANKIAVQIQGQQPQTSQPTGQADITQYPPPSTPQQGQGSRPRVLGTIFQSLFGQRSQQGIQQQQPIQGVTQPVQKGQPDVAQIQKDLQDKQTREHEKRIKRQQKMSATSGDDRA